MRKEISKILAKLARADYNENDVSEEIADYIERNFYPKEFIKWWMGCNPKKFAIEDIYEHWVNNIKDELAKFNDRR